MALLVDEEELPPQPLPRVLHDELMITLVPLGFLFIQWCTASHLTMLALLVVVLVCLSYSNSPSLWFTFARTSAVQSCYVPFLGFYALSSALSHHVGVNARQNVFVQLACLIAVRAYTVRSRIVRRADVLGTRFSAYDHVTPELVQRHRLPMHAPTASYPDEDTARTLQRQKSVNVLSLSSATAWRFRLFSSPNMVPKRFWRSMSGFQTIAVPSHWELEGYSEPIYTNVKHPIDVSPPAVDDHDNPTGCYVRRFDIPSSWVEERRRVSIIFFGVSSCFHVYLNDVEVGMSKDSRLFAEFDVTAHVREHNNVLAVRVVRWSDSCPYIEDQDHWFLSGIYREVELCSKPSMLTITDFSVQTKLRDNYRGALVNIVVKIRRDDIALTNGQLLYRLHDDVNGKIIESRREVKLGEQQELVSLQVDHPRLWSAEDPQLYTLTIGVILSSSERVLEWESCRVGIREVRIEDGTLLINSRPVLLKGVNRHDHDERNGKCVSEALMRLDITKMKQFNFNAVRTSHYPNHYRFYDLCDEMGMYVIDEANIECHGDSIFPATNLVPRCRLACDPAYANAFFTRVSRMIIRDRNHACVVIWSLGNESGTGPNLERCRRWIGGLDHSRPVQYESNGSPRTLSDLLVPMYHPVKHICAEVELDPRPLVLCEYGHAMGNSCGSLDKYWEAFRAHPRLQGGFVWDWVDQALLFESALDGEGEVDDDGRPMQTRNSELSALKGVVEAHRAPSRASSSAHEATRAKRYLYGGDFGASVHDGNFCCNGLMAADRTPHPAAFEAKWCQQPVRLKCVEKGEDYITLEVFNENLFVDLGYVVFEWELQVDERIVGRHQPLPFTPSDVQPEQAARVTLRYDMLLQREHFEGHACFGSWITVRAKLRKKNAWAEAGHVVAYAQFPVSLAAQSPPPSVAVASSSASGSGSVHLSVRDGVVYATNTFAQTVAQIGATSANEKGAVLSHWRGGDIGGSTRRQSELVRSVRLSVFRAPTDNDTCGGTKPLDMPPKLHGLLPIVSFFFSASIFDRAWLLRSRLLRAHNSYGYLWRQLGLDRIGGGRVEDVRVVDDHTVQLNVSLAQLARAQLNVLFHPGDVVLIRSTIDVSPQQLQNITTLPRVGLRLDVDPSLEYYETLSMGPHENYSDRKASALMGCWSGRVSERTLPYVRPCEHGGMEDAYYVAMRESPGGSGFVALPVGYTAHISVSEYSVETLDCTEHAHELRRPRSADGAMPPLELHFDYKHMGVGGENSWLPNVHQEFLLTDDRYDFSVAFAALQASQSAAEVAKRVSREIASSKSFSTASSH